MKNYSTSIVIFGASGDLTRRKLIPSLYSLFEKDKLPTDFRIVGYGGTHFSDEAFRTHLLGGLVQFCNHDINTEQWDEFKQHLYYHQGRYTRKSDFESLSEYLTKLEKRTAQRLYYMSIPPNLFPDIISNLDSTHQLKEDKCWRRVVVEKPFGTDLASAKKLNEQIHKVLKEDQIYRIDHYLGKETVQNIMFTRFANTIFEPLWNRNYIDSVQITVAEKVDVGHRAGYYDGVGVLRDMFQNHLLQLVALIAMEPPASFNANALRNEKVKVLSAIPPITGEDITRNTVRAQYAGYCDEPEVKENSTTPTFAAMRLFINNWRWQGVPFYLRSGKNMAMKQTQIIIGFKNPPLSMFPMPPGKQIKPNLLMLNLQPDEGVHLRFEAKAPDTISETRSVDMEFHYAETFGPTAIPEAYERLLLDILQGDAALFTRADEVETAWSLINPILDYWKNNPTSLLATYAPGSWGPKEADDLIRLDGRWWLHEESRHV